MRLEAIIRNSVKRIRQLVVHVPYRRRGTRVVFLGGVQRSGTNMIMEVLDQSPDTEMFDEDNSRAFVDFQLRGDEVVHNLARSGAPCVVFKALCDNDRILTLMSGFSCSATVWMYRHYDGVIASHLRRWPEIRNGIDRLVTDRSAAGWRGRGMTTDTWEIIKRHYRPAMNSASTVALFWVYRNQLFFDQHLDSDRRVHLLRYESVVSDPVGQLSTLARFMKIRLTSRMIERVSSPSRDEMNSQPVDPDILQLCESMLRRLDLLTARQESGTAASLSLEQNDGAAIAATVPGSQA